MDLEFIGIQHTFIQKQRKQHNNRVSYTLKQKYLLKPITFYNLNMEIYGKCN